MCHVIKALLAVLLVLASAPRAAARDNPHLVRGVKLLDQAEDEKALRAFKRALKRRGSSKAGRARIHLYLGVTRMNLGQEELARKHFRVAFRLDPRADLPPDMSPKMHQLAEEVRQEQPPGPAPTVTPPTVAPVTPVVVRRQESGSALTYWPAWTVLALGLAAGGTGLAMGLLSRKNAEEASDLGQPTSTAESKHDTAKTQALTANIMFGVAGAAAITAGVLFYVGSRRTGTTTAGIVPLRGGALVHVGGLAW